MRGAKLKCQEVKVAGGPGAMSSSLGVRADCPTRCQGLQREGHMEKRMERGKSHCSRTSLSLTVTIIMVDILVGQLG